MHVIQSLFTHVNPITTFRALRFMHREVSDHGHFGMPDSARESFLIAQRGLYQNYWILFIIIQNSCTSVPSLQKSVNSQFSFSSWVIPPNLTDLEMNFQWLHLYVCKYMSMPSQYFNTKQVLRHLFSKLVFHNAKNYINGNFNSV